MNDIDFEILDEIFIWNMSDKAVLNGTLASLNGDGSGIEFKVANGVITGTIVKSSSYWRIKEGDRYKFVENRAGGMIFKRIN